jgi:hypothetical protein
MSSETFYVNEINRDYVEGRREYPTIEKKLRLWFTLVSFFVICMITLLYLESLPRIINQYELDLFGHSITGEVIETGINTGPNPDEHFAVVQYRVGSQSFRNRVQIRKNEYNRLGVGDSIQLQYLPYDPSISRANPNPHSLLLVIGAPIVLIVFLIVFVRRENHWRKMRERWRELAIAHETITLDAKIRIYNGYAREGERQTATYEFISPQTGNVIKDRVDVFPINHSFYEMFKNINSVGKVIYLNDDTYALL